MKKLRLLLATLFASLCYIQAMWAAAEWNEYEFTFNSDENSLDVKGGEKVFMVDITVPDDATFIYECRFGSEILGEVNVYLDNNLYQHITTWESNKEQRYFVNLTEGEHHIEWKFVNPNTNRSAYIYSYNFMGALSTPTTTINLLEPGSLGTEVLYQLDHLKQVKKLVVKGKMNSDDWANIMLMTNLFSLDLTDADITEIPDYQLSYNRHSNLEFFHEVKLPKTLRIIGLIISLIGYRS